MHRFGHILCLTIHSSRRRFAARLNSGVRPVKSNLPRFLCKVIDTRTAHDLARHFLTSLQRQEAFKFATRSRSKSTACVRLWSKSQSGFCAADTAPDFVVQIGVPACSLYGILQERTGLTIRSSRCHFTAAVFFGMFVLVCGRAAARLNSGVRFSAELFWAVLALH